MKHKQEGSKSGNPKCGMVNQLLRKLEDFRNALRLITFEFDEYFLQVCGLLGSLTSKLENEWQFSTLNYLSSSTIPFEEEVAKQLPPLISPMESGLSGPSGSVPVPFSFTWTRYQPHLEYVDTLNRDVTTVATTNADLLHSNRDIVRVKLKSIHEPEVVVLLNIEQIKALLNLSGDKPIHENSNLKAFGLSLAKLNRPVTCIFLIGTNVKSSSVSSSSVQIPINELCAELQLLWNVHTTRLCSTIHDVATILHSYTRSIAERPFKDRRLHPDKGFTFLPDTVCKGLPGRASRGLGSGRIPSTDLTKALNQDYFSHSWANRVWLAQLGQWRGITGEIANAISLVYPTARSLYNACEQSETTQFSTTAQIDDTSTVSFKQTHPFEPTLANLQVRRGTGVLASTRRLGPEFSRRIIKLFISENPDEIIF